MGRCDSSTQYGGHSAICAAGGGPTEAAATRMNGREAPSAGAWALLVLLRAYMVLLSPFFGGACKFYPSCSNYAYEAVARHGARKGAALAMRRLLRCRPFTKGGFDPVPEICFGEDTREPLKRAADFEAAAAPDYVSHRPTHAVVEETWSGAGALGVERQL